MNAVSRDAPERARRVRLMLFDVDGVLTDGRLWYGPGGEEMKAFSVLDGQGIKLLADSGVAVGVLSGRRSPAAAARCADLGLDHVLLGIEDKLSAWEDLRARLGLAPDACGYMGDDLIDLKVMRRCGFSCAPREALDAVRSLAHYVCAAPAGAGAAREACEFVMRAQNTWSPAISRFLD